MALLDFLKNKKEKEKAKKPAEKRAELVSGKKEIKITGAPESKPVSTGKGQAFSYDIVKDPHISEKGTILAESDKYVFKVYDRANKLEIKKAIEGIYRVDVMAVNIITIPHKKRRLGKTEGFKKGYKKALVTIKKGQKIEVF